MKQYPLFLNLKGKKVAVFGAGRVALRKIKDLLQSGARVEVTSLEFLPEIKRLATSHPSLKLISKVSTAALLKGAALAFAATSDSGWNAQVARECKKRGIPVNVADQPALCDFQVPSLFKKGRLEVAISTGGASPLLAKKFREELNQKIRPEAIRVLNRMPVLRGRAKRAFASQAARKNFLEKQISSDFHFITTSANGSSKR
jgi:siroheme synthase-like protein